MFWFDTMQKITVWTFLFIFSQNGGNKEVDLEEYYRLHVAVEQIRFVTEHQVQSDKWQVYWAFFLKPKMF